MEHLKNLVYDNVKTASGEMEKIILKLELELKREDLTPQEMKCIQTDIVNLRYMIRSVTTLQVLMPIGVRPIDFM